MFIGGIDLELTPQLDGLVTGDISTNTNAVTLNKNTFIFYSQNKPVSVGMDKGQVQSTTNTFE